MGCCSCQQSSLVIWLAVVTKKMIEFCVNDSFIAVILTVFIIIIIIIIIINIILPAKAREYVFTGVGFGLCVCVCLSVTTITKKIVDGFVPNFTRRFLGGKGRPSLCFVTIGGGMWK